MDELLTAIQRFVGSSQRPVVSEPGEELIEINSQNFSLDERQGALFLQAWDNRRNLVRRVTGIASSTRSRLVLRVERFGRKTGTLTLLDLLRADRTGVERNAARLEFREIFRRFLRREFSEYKLTELSTEANLEHSLSPAYPRALLRQGSIGLAAIACPPEPSGDALLSFGLIWLDYLRRRETGLTIRGLVLFLPAGREANSCLRLKFLDPKKGRFSIHTYHEDGRIQQVDVADSGNVDTHLDPCCHPGSEERHELCRELSSWPGVDSVEGASGDLSFRVHGLEFAKFSNGQLVWGLETKRMARTSNLSEIRTLAGELLRIRSSDATDRQHPLFLRQREAWLESRVRAQVEQLDATLMDKPIYGQVPAAAGCDRGVLDLLAIDRRGRLAVIELKASQDIHLPLQALDYWLRVKWHLDRREFTQHGYFPGIQISSQPPRLLLVAPSLEFHPMNERVLRFFSPEVEVERMGVGLEWQKQLKLMYRM